MPELFEKCKDNLERGLRVYLLVPDAIAIGRRQNTALVAGGRIAVESIESFVATNVDELCEFDGNRLKSGFRRLLETYNARVDGVELDKSMLIGNSCQLRLIWWILFGKADRAHHGGGQVERYRS